MLQPTTVQKPLWICTCLNLMEMLRHLLREVDKIRLSIRAYIFHYVRWKWGGGRFKKANTKGADEPTLVDEFSRRTSAIICEWAHCSLKIGEYWCHSSDVGNLMNDDIMDNQSAQSRCPFVSTLMAFLIKELLLCLILQAIGWFALCTRFYGSANIASPLHICTIEKLGSQVQVFHSITFCQYG